MELTLDGNAACNEPIYRGAVLELCRSLRSLDLRRVTDEERRQANRQMRREGERAQERARREQAEEERSATLRHIQLAWQRRRVASDPLHERNCEAPPPASATGRAMPPTNGGLSAGGSPELLGLTDVEQSASGTKVFIFGAPAVAQREPNPRRRLQAATSGYKRLQAVT